MKNIMRLVLLLAVFNTNFSHSQEEIQLTSKDSIVISAWTFGLGYNIVDDSATPFGKDFLNIKDTWHMLPYPARLSIGRLFKSGIGIEAIATANRYKVGKKVDGRIIDSPRNYYAIDGEISYDLNKLIGETAWFDPYLHVGAGYSSIGGLGRSTANAGFGFNTWFNDKLGLNLSTMGKWGIEKGSTKQLQHAAGVVYRFGIEKELSKKGKEKLALIEEMEKEKQRVADSIATADRLKEEALLAERLAQEREKARLAAAEKAKLDAENSRKRQIEDEINALGNAHFALNSSFLATDAKIVLDGLASILASNPDVVIQVTSHADSRGADKYNLWLSERRANRTVDYLVKKGIPKERLKGIGVGEEYLTNHCSDGVYCSKEEHRVNRRSEFTITNF